jgi:hypothetical protein
MRIAFLLVLLCCVVVIGCGCFSFYFINLFSFINLLGRQYMVDTANAQQSSNHMS